MTEPTKREFAVVAIGVVLAAAALGLVGRALEPEIGSFEWCRDMLRATGELDARCPRLRLDSGLEPADYRMKR